MADVIPMWRDDRLEAFWGLAVELHHRPDGSYNSPLRDVWRFRASIVGEPLELLGIDFTIIRPHRHPFTPIPTATLEKCGADLYRRIVGDRKLITQMKGLEVYGQLPREDA